MPLTPNKGSTGGGTTVVITGTNLSGTSAVRFGTKLATITGNTPTSVTVLSPSGTGTVNVTVTTPGGVSNPLPFFYIGAPIKTGLSQSSGPTAGTNTISISGTGLSTATAVNFGAAVATPTAVNDGLLSVVVPAGAGPGPVGVSVTTAGGTNNGLYYTYVDSPTALTLDPVDGPTSGGTTVTIAGTNLSTTQSVTFDGVPAPFSVIDDSNVSAVTPPGTAGPVDVVLTNEGGAITETDGFTYNAGPGI